MKQELFAATLRHSECIEELLATREIVSHEISVLRSNDSRGEEDSSLKPQLNSLLSLRKAIDARINRLQSGSETGSIGLPAQVDWNQTIGPGLELFALPVEVLLKNNVALSYFIDFMSSIGCQAYIFFYLNIEGWKVSAEQQLHALELEAFERSQRGHLDVTPVTLVAELNGEIGLCGEARCTIRPLHDAATVVELVPAEVAQLLFVRNPI